MEEGAKIVLPCEIYEKILNYADGYTLMRAKHVCKQWRDIVEYLEKKCNIWKRCCHDSMPPEMLFAMTKKYGCKDDEKKWKTIFRNWFLWQNLKGRTHEIVDNGDTSGLGDITCIKASGNRIIYGNTAGCLIVISEFYIFLDIYMSFMHSNVRDLHFMNEKASYNEVGFKHTHLLIVYDTSVILLRLEPNMVEVENLTNLSQICVYGKCLCYAERTGIVYVSEVDFENSSVNIITTCRIYGPTVVRSLCIWEETVTIVSDANVMNFTYKKAPPFVSPQILQEVSVCYGTVENYWIFYNRILFCAANAELHFFTLSSDETKRMSKKYNCMQLLGGCVCHIHLHGAVLFLSLSNGVVLIYCVKDWMVFNLENYDYKLYLSGGPVRGIDVQELRCEHKMVFAMDKKVAQVFINF